MANPGYKPVPTTGGLPRSPADAATRTWVRQIADAVNNLLRGKLNVVLQITLDANADSTTVIDARIGAYSAVSLQPLTTNAATASYAAPFILPSDQKDGSVVLLHANNAETDRTLNLLIIG